MARIRTIFGLQKKESETLDGFYTTEEQDVRCWMDGEGNLYGATLIFAHEYKETDVEYGENGVMTITRRNKDKDNVKLLLEEQTGKSLRPVNVSGIIPYLKIDGYGWSPEERPPKHWWHNKTLRSLGGRYSFKVLPLVITKKYARKMKVNEVRMEEMRTTVKAIPSAWSVV